MVLIKKNIHLSIWQFITTLTYFSKPQERIMDSLRWGYR